MGRNIQNSKWASHQQLLAQKSEAKFNEKVAEFVKAKDEKSITELVEKATSKPVKLEPEVIVPVVEESTTQVEFEVPW